MGKAAIHCAATAGNIQLMRLLLEFKADVDIGVSCGAPIVTPRHFADLCTDLTL
jgi:ankyrin repeat protein